MRIWLSLTVVAIAGGVWAEAADFQRAAQRLQADYPGVQVYVENERPVRIYGSVFGLGNSPEQTADDFVNLHSELLGVSPEDLLPGNRANGQFTQPVMPDRQTGEYKFTLVYYSQSIDGIPVYGGDLRLLMRNEPGYPLVLAASNVRDLGRFRVPAGVMASLDQRAGIDAARALVPSLTTFGDPELVVWAGSETERAAPRIAYVFVADNYAAGTNRPEKWRFVTDATTGKVLHRDNLILFTAITGNVRANVTAGTTSAECGPEFLQALPYAEVGIVDSESVFTDATGEFEIPYGSDTEVTVESPMRGRYFVVDNHAGEEETVSELVTPPGPVTLIHNEDNTDEAVRAQSNGYLHANLVRDFILEYNPDYPTISTQTDFPVNVNRVDGYCPGNAWYDGSSINFCSSSINRPNTAYSSIVYHEYGHHLVESGGSGQAAYGEGMSDSVAALLTNESVLAYGFFGDCDTGLRDADNDYQYPCSGSSHDCGNLLSGCVWSTRTELLNSGYLDYLDIIRSLTINSVLLHSGTSITPSITIDFLTLDDDDGDIYNGTPHAAEICAGFGAHNMDCPEINFAPIGFEYPDGQPEYVLPNQSAAFGVNVVPLLGTPVAGTGELHYRLNGGTWVTVAMTETTPNEYVATLPSAGCGSAYEWYVSAEAAGEGLVTHPSSAPEVIYYVPVATSFEVTFEDDFESDTGWIVEAGAATGNWERADPQEVVSGFFDPIITQPEDDHSPGDGTLCFVTGATAGGGAGSYDVDGGPARLMSPMLDLAYDGTIGYWRWYHISTELDDDFVVEVSNDDGVSWTTVETLGYRLTWTYSEWRLSDFVTPTDQVRVRFTVWDTDPGSLIEALIDDFVVRGYSCESPILCAGDVNCDGVVDFDDIDPFVAALGCSDGDPSCWNPTCPWINADCNGDELVDFDDIDAFVALMGTTCP